MKQLEWNVIYHNVNMDRIETFNVFRHGSFMNDVQKAVKQCKTKEAFSEEVRKSMMYYFCSKAEWEVLISPWVGSRNKDELKVDVYWQVNNNWEIFVDYIWNTLKK